MPVGEDVGEQHQVQTCFHFGLDQTGVWGTLQGSHSLTKHTGTSKSSPTSSNRVFFVDDSLF
jgi:hypothetical protein